MSETRQVRLLASARQGVTGEILGVTAAVAARWVGEGLAEYVEATPAETAMSEPPANAMRPRGRARKVKRR